MENKEYYTPDIEDLFVGYECEELVGGCWKNNIPKNSVTPFVCEERWKPKKFSTIISDGYGKPDFTKLRTPFLSNEDIQKEGWEILKDSEDYFDLYKGSPVIFQCRQYILKYSTHFLISIENEYFTKYVGECKSINEFRKLIKWLNIK